MASPPPVSQPVPTRSPEKANISLRHPIPDLQSLQGAYVGNIERLEEHAERMSESGSDLGEEIRKMHVELKRSDSRRSSLRSGAPLEDNTRQFTTRSRNVSTSSHANSIVDVNGAARWGGYSPAGYITSPAGSLRSGSFSNPGTSMQRQRSGSKASRLGQVVHPEEVIDEHGRFPDHPGSPNSLRSAPLALHNSNSPPAQDTRKVSSFTRKYDEIANELREELRNSVILDQPPNHDDQDHREEYHYQYANHNDYPDRPPTAASTDTTRQARTLWQDFDGVHCPDTVPEEEPTPPHSSGGHSRQSSYNSMLRSYDLPQQGAPPPDDGMVFYPAPVPRMLNLPKRLSQLPSTSVQNRRRTQLLDSMQAEHRKSAPMLGDMLSEPVKPPMNNRKSIAALPPQLRASAYFDQAAPAQEFAVKGESAEDTLDSILNASARAPVSAFTDHPFAGHVGDEVYGPEQHKRKTSKLPDLPPKLEETKRRSSFIMLDTKRNSSGDMLNKLKKRNSSADMNLLVVKASQSRMSLADELDEHEEHARGPQTKVDGIPSQQSYDDHDGRNPDDVYDEEHEDDEEEEEDPQMEEELPQFGAPTTLLAELQLRKAQQKTRNMNYATLVEQGNMPTHRTLLELDDMAEKEKQKRMRKKVNLAWEAPPEEDDSDDDVPLGVLYKPQNQQNRHEWDRPVGLIAQRELEDHEPLSRRRARLRGDDPNAKRGLGISPSQAHLVVPTTTTPGPESEDEVEGETLGERMRRLREKKELEAALGDDVRKSTISADFATEMFSKLGLPDSEKEAPKPTPSPGVEEEETLGQRRARLQAEAAARGDLPATRPGLPQSMNLANVLSANPLDMHNQARKISDSQLVSHLPQGSLLHQNVLAEEKRKAERLHQNMRASSYGSHDPLLRNVNQEKNDDDVPLALKIQAYKNKMAGVGTMPMGMQNPSSLNLSQRDSSMPNMAMGMGMGMPMNMNMPMNMMMQNPQMMPMMPNMQFQYPTQQQQQQQQGNMMNMPMGMGMGMPQMGMQMPMNMNMGMGMGMNMNQGMGMGMGMMMPPMDPRQRDNIDRWMQGIQH